MIIYEMRKPTELSDGAYAGVTGENLACTLEFLIKGMTDSDLDYHIHLRFSDDSVNSVIPDSTEITDEGTHLVWQIKKNDIFAHGCFELQIEGRTSDDDGLVFQTEIVTLYADESLAIEDAEYANPNSETLKLRDEAEAALAHVKEQQAQLEENLAEIEKTGITDKESLSNKVTDNSNVTTDSYPSVTYLKTYYYTAEAVDEKLDDAASQISAAEDEISKLDARLSANEGDVETLENSLSETNAALTQKPDYESGSGTLQVASTSYGDNEGTYSYVKVGDIVMLTVTITKTNSSLKYFAMKGFPYAGNSNTKLDRTMAATSKLAQCWVTIDKTWITFLKNSGNFVDGETITATVIYTV